MRISFLLGSLALLSAGCGDAEPTKTPAPERAKFATEEIYRPDPARPPLPRPSMEPVEPSRIVPVRMGKYAEWSYEEYLKPVGFRMSDMMVIVRGPDFPEGRDPVKNMPSAIIRQIRIQAPGRPDFVHEDEFVVPWADHRFGYGQFDRWGTPFVLVQHYTGGAHCCGQIDLFILHPHSTEHVELGSWDGFDVPDVRDYDGDGLVDFVVTDESFNGMFTAYVDSRFPPMILNVVDGRVRDVSTKPGFRQLFARAASSLRRECTRATDREAQDGACPAYVAAAARAGMFRKAWAELIATYRHRNRLMNIYGRPSDIEDERYAEKLRGFLVERGYRS